MENLATTRDNINRIWNKYSRRQKIIGIGSAIAIIVIIAIFIMVITKPKYSPLYTDLDLESMSSVKKALDDMGVNYKIQNSDTIMVKQEDKNRIMIDLAGQNIPQAKFDYSDLIGMNSMFMSDDEKNTAKNYALSNGIEKVIESIPEVDKAYVNLTIPKSNEFILQENKLPTKASVLIVPSENKTLDKDAVDGIASLVANSVEGLTLDNVTIHGPSGRVLNRKDDKTGFGDMSENISLQKKVEEDISETLHNFLTPMLGYENISVMTSVRLNFDTNKTQSEVFNPPVEGETSGLVRSEQNANEQVINNKPGLGNPGVDANDNPEGTPDYVTVDENGNSQYQRNESIINYELNRIVNEVEKAKGQITDVTVSVILNKDSLPGGELDDEKQKQITKLITSATGIDTRQVQLFVESFKVPENMTDRTSQGNMPLWMWIVIIITALIPLIALAIYLIRRNRVKKQEEIERQRELEKMGLDENGNQRQSEDEAIKGIEVSIKESSYKKSIEDLVNKNPEIVASLLKTWINEDN